MISRKTKRIHVNQHNIKWNKKHWAERKPVISVKTYDENVYGNGVVIYDKDGEEVARLVYRPHNPLACGATLWIETKNEIEILN